MPTLIVRIPDRQVQNPPTLDNDGVNCRVIGPLPDAMEPGFHGVRTPWIRGFMAFQPTGRG
jgi:hypothetical protein